VRNGLELREWVLTSLRQLTHAVLPFVNAAHSEPGRVAEFDRVCEAFTTNHVANRASRVLGKALVAAVERTFGVSVRGESLQPPYCHFAPVYGATTRSLALPNEQSTRLFVFMHLRSVVAASVRLNIVGPMEGQAIQFQFSEEAESVAQNSAQLGLNDLSQTAPLLDLWQGAQDRLYSRLFQT